MIENDPIFDALGASQRRRLLVELLHRERIDVAELTADSREMADASPALLEQFLSSQREIANVDKKLLRAHHSHLPKLDDHEFIEWDEDASAVTRGTRYHEIRPLLEVMERLRDEADPEKVLVPARG